MKTVNLSNKNDAVETCYISSGCNRTPHCMDWGVNNLICYGSRNAVNIYIPEGKHGKRVVKSLSSHKDRVNVVRWIRSTQNTHETELISGSTDNNVIVWSLIEGDFKVTAQLSGHTGPINAIDGMYNNKSGPKSVILVSASGDSSLKIWQRNGDENHEFNCTETISLKTGLCFCLKILMLSNTVTPVLAFATDSCQVHLYLLEETCVKLTSLSGHEDWIRAIDFINLGNGNMMLATSSQDTTVRLWKITESSEEVEDGTFKLAKIEFQVDKIKFSVGLESVLCGHEGWVYGLQWAPQTKDSDLILMTASLDRTIILWSADPESGVWLESARMGELGGNTLGYFGCKFSTTAKQILAHSYQGSFHMWINDEDQWKPGVTVGGHFDSVVDIGWEREGMYLLSTGLDQTTRLHAPWVGDSCSDCSWHEMSRPQVHGYAMNCLTILPEFSFVSGAEEKVARAFKAPKNTLENLKFLANVKVKDSFLEGCDSEPTGAAVPALGLSNKAVFTDKDNLERQHPNNPKDEYSETYFVPQHFKEPANEDALLQNTLWPEVMKLYGHGYEVFSLASTHQGHIVASTCKASTAQHAKIFLWDTKTWEKCDELAGHQLTVTQMAFSPDDKYLLSVSRDRKWCLFERDQETDKYILKSTTDKSTGIHTRIIWTCSWSHDSLYFATGSRDGKLVMWSVTDNESKPPLNGVSAVGNFLETKEAITAVDFAPVNFVQDSKIYLLVLGFESGIIQFYSWMSQSNSNWTLLTELDNNIAHHLTVKRLQFRPRLGKTGDYTNTDLNTLQLASASLDNSVKVFNVRLQCLNSAETVL
ncbi:hypothetical protein O3M35_012428 [Rhynocoris fuscipes]|uniref:Elongator complex protein 2 n=1 Tax=Rhynocoris fuscipes TaxID=488301 RepID=A0AAW1CTY3_9HEMI